MVLIPAGSFEMGDHFNEGLARERPVHMVKLDAFYMDKDEVTVRQFRKFVRETGYEYDRWDDVAKYSPTDKHPMILVSWFDATAYCEWAGKRLPTEKEREFADWGGLFNKEFPWGDDESIAREYANFSGTEGTDQWQYIAPVGSLKPNGYGLYDMSGNVWEWCQDWYDNSRIGRVLRGGSWLNLANCLRAAGRNYNDPTGTYNDYGFRCVVDVP